MLLDDSMDAGRSGKGQSARSRMKDDRLAMLDAFVKGKIDMLASDHAPHGQDEKAGDFDAAPSGVPGVETSVPIMMAMVKRGPGPAGTPGLRRLPTAGRDIRSPEGQSSRWEGTPT